MSDCAETKKGRGGRRKGAGRKGLRPTDEDRRQVETMSGLGINQELIARLVCGGISVDTLSRHFAKEIEEGRAKAAARLAQTAFQRAINGSDTMLIFLCKVHPDLRWRDVNRHEVSGPEGVPLFSHIERIIVDPKERKE